MASFSGAPFPAGVEHRPREWRLQSSRSWCEADRRLGPAAEGGPVLVLLEFGLDNAVVGDPFVDLRQHLFELRARKMGALATVGADAERDMPIGEAIDHELVRISEGGLVSRGASAKLGRGVIEKHGLAFKIGQ